MRRFSVLTINTLIVFVSVVLAVSLGEVYFRFFKDPSLYLRFSYEDDLEGIESTGVPDSGFYENTPLGKRLKVNAKGFVRNHHLTGTDIAIRTNKFGFRGPKIENDERAKVLFLGDSITLGDYLEEQNTFTSLVGVMSAKTLYPMQTINAGVGAIGIEEELNILREYGYRVSPELIILNLYLNDTQASPALHLKPIPAGLRWSRIAQHSYQTLSIKAYEADAQRSTWVPRETENAWREQVEMKYPAAGGNWVVDRRAYNRMMYDWFADWGAAYSEGAQNRMMGISQEIIDLSQALGAKIMVVIHPTRFQVETEFNANEPQQQFIKYFEQAGVPVHDLLPAFRRSWANNRDNKLFYDHCHHSIAGAAIAANEIFQFIMSNELPAEVKVGIADGEKQKK